MKIIQVRNTLAVMNAQYRKRNIIHFPFEVERLYDSAIVIRKHELGRIQDTYQKLSRELSEYDNDVIVYYADNEADTPVIIRKITFEHLKNGQYYEEKIPRFCA